MSHRVPASQGKTLYHQASQRLWQVLVPAGLSLLLVSGSSLAAQKRALLIGINEYRANDADQPAPDPGVWLPEDLGGALNDVALIRQLLLTRFGFPEDQIQVLTDEAATREGILTAFEELIAASGPEDSIFIHYSGHGSQVEDLDQDEADGKDETLVPHDARMAGVPDITDDELGLLLARLETPDVFVVMDACHSGTATRSGVALKTRNTPVDRRSELYKNLPGAGESPGLGHVLMTGAADNQSALDGPIADGRHYGLFTLSLGRALERLDATASAREIHREVRKEMQRIGDEFGLYAIPRSQLEGRDEALDSPLLSTATAQRAWLTAVANDAGEIALGDAGSLGAQKGSLWAVYGPDETQFRPGTEQAVVRIQNVGEQGATAAVQGRGEGDISAFTTGNRLVRLAPPPARERIPVLLDRMNPERRAFWTEALSTSGLPLKLAGPDEPVRYRLDEESDVLVMRDATGLQVLGRFPAHDENEVIQGLNAALTRSQRVAELMALEDPSASLRVDVRATPLDSTGKVRGISMVAAAPMNAYVFRAPGAPRGPWNSLQLEVTASHDAYLTVINVGPQGELAQLFPNPISDRNGFLPGGQVKGGRSVRIPDSLGPNRAGFHWDLVPPSGMDTVFVFAASNPDLANRLRAHVASLSTSSTVRGSSTEPSRLALYQRTDASALRGGNGADGPGQETAAAAVGWASASVTVVIEDPES